MGFGLMMNNWMQMVSGQSGLLRFCRLETMVEKYFLANRIDLGWCAD